MITSSLAMPLIATTTLATIIFIALGFMPTPSRAAALWSAAFSSAMVGSYMWLAYELWDLPTFRALGAGLAIAPMALIWSGLRARRRAKRQYVALSVAYLIVMPAVLLASAFTPAYGVTFRVVLAVTAVFAAMTIIELIRLGQQKRDESYPLLGACAAFIIFAVVSIVDGVLVARRITDNPDSLQFLRTINLVGIIVFVICALVTTMLLTARGQRGQRTAHSAFETTVRDRLNRAEAANDPWWSVLDIRLDDPDEIRGASSTAAFNSTSDRFARDVDLALPADADLEQMSATRVIALLPRAQGGVREILADLLERLANVDESQAVPIRLSASIGWAQVQTAGYGFDDLLAAASAAVKVAQANGGDRWERVRDTTD
ncbi:MAG TPA: hypothetical protein DIW46_00895 [Microbacterium sp.]|nr:hypothetical protein [Microbacterium sp.]